MAGRRMVIDADIHPVIDDRRIADFLPEPWRRRYQSGNRGPGTLGYWNPNGVMRADAVTEEGERIEGAPGRLGQHFLDPFDNRTKRRTSASLRPTVPQEPQGRVVWSGTSAAAAMIVAAAAVPHGALADADSACTLTVMVGPLD